MKLKTTMKRTLQNKSDKRTENYIRKENYHFPTDWNDTKPLQGSDKKHNST